MTYSELKAAIAEVIKTNYNQEITAVVLHDPGPGRTGARGGPGLHG